MGNGASQFVPVWDVLVDARDRGKAASKAMCSDALFVGCKQKEDDAFRACDYDGERATTTPEKKAACNKAAHELRRCLRANLGVIKALAAEARAMHDEEYNSDGK